MIKNYQSVCRRCPLAESRSCVIHSQFTLGARLAIISGAPGKEDDESGLLFSGFAGEMVDKLLCMMSMKRQDIYLGYAVRCRPPSDRQPVVAEISACNFWLGPELDMVVPEAIILLGKMLTERYMGKGAWGKVTSSESHQIRQIWHGTNLMLIPIWSPAYVEAYKQDPCIIAEYERQLINAQQKVAFHLSNAPSANKPGLTWGMA